MRSAWSATRSMSLETLFVVLPSCLLALPTFLATDWTSTPDRRGTLIPRTFFRREWPFSMIPPASPTAVAPTATAGPLTLPAAPLIVPTTPPLPVPFWLAVLRLEFEPELLLLRRFAAGFLRVPVAAVERVRDEAFERVRDEALCELALALGLALGLDLGFGLALDPELPDVARAAPCPLREAG